MRVKSETERVRLLECCFECFCENGLENTSSKKLAEACGMSSGNIFHYFETKDEIVIKSTAYSMTKVEDDFMANAPKNLEELDRFLNETPYWTAKQHGAKYRFMYQVYSSPKYRRYGKQFFAGVKERYTEYAKSLWPQLGIPWQMMQSLIYVFVRACVHYVLFEDEGYLKPQIRFLQDMLPLIVEKYSDASK